MPTLTPENTLASYEVTTKKSTFLANVAAIPAFTPLKRDLNKKLIPATAVADVVVGITIPRHGSNSEVGLLPIPITATDFEESYYTEAKIYASAVNWSFYGVPPATNPAKQAVFDGTGIDIITAGSGF